LSGALKHSARFVALAGIKQNDVEMFQALSGQLDNKGLKLTCKAKTARNQAFCRFFILENTCEARQTGLRGFKAHRTAVF
jgi:hypothetical protein